MNHSALSIGVFDSGMGGLSVLKALRALMPHESFIYLGDTARLPYGTKSADTVIKYAHQMGCLLVERGIKCLVVACNTATTAALADLQASFPQIPVIGVIEPGAMAAVNASHGGEIAVIATETTIRSDIYRQTILKRAPKAMVNSKACGLFVALAEEGCVDNELARVAVVHYLTPLLTKCTDTLLLGCTHFPALVAPLQAFVGDTVTIVDSAEATACAVQQALAARRLATDETVSGQVRYLVTDLPERFSRVSSVFLGKAVSPAEIERV